MFKILFVEDDATAVADAKELLEKSGHFCTVCSFGEAENHIQNFGPDIIILDLLQGPSSAPAQTGRITLDFIWKIRFCPIIIYSAAPEYLDDDDRVTKHPLIRRVKKGSGSHLLLKQTLDQFNGHIVAMQNAGHNLNQAFSMAIRDIAEISFPLYNDPKIRDEVLIRCGRRRVSALIDSTLTTERIVSWEQFIFPPINSDLMLGDIIRETSDESKLPTSFRIVLTPSCDLAVRGSGKSQVDKALVARCFPISELKTRTALCKVSEGDDLKKALISNVLSQGFYQKMLVIPNLPEVLPDMVANLKELEFVPISEISNIGDKKFVRIASVDSPFRELVSWAYLQIACRPGLPDRDFDTWAEKILPQLAVKK